MDTHVGVYVEYRYVCICSQKHFFSERMYMSKLTEVFIYTALFNSVKFYIALLGLCVTALYILCDDRKTFILSHYFLSFICCHKSHS